MKANGITNYQLVLSVGDDEAKSLIGKPSASKGPKHYAVPEGRQPGKIHSTWEYAFLSRVQTRHASFHLELLLTNFSGPNGAKENTSRYPGAAYMRLNNEKAARKFNKDFEDMRDQVAPTTTPRAPILPTMVVTSPSVQLVRRDQMAPTIASRAPGSARIDLKASSDELMRRYEIDPWSTNLFPTIQAPIDHLVTAFGTSMNLRGNLSGGTRLTKVEPDGTQWIREEVYSYNFETQPQQNNRRRNRGPRHMSSYNGEGRVQDLEASPES